jgi:hypothetical protein
MSGLQRHYGDADDRREVRTEGDDSFDGRVAVFRSAEASPEDRGTVGCAKDGVMRKALYFDQTIGNYVAGEWYDNVPDDDFKVALEHGLAHEVTDAPEECGCKLANGKAVSVAIILGQPCQLHVKDALRKPEEKPERKIGRASAKKLGLVKT